jgi:hypothetical protein
MASQAGDDMVNQQGLAATLHMLFMCILAPLNLKASKQERKRSCIVGCG